MRAQDRRDASSPRADLPVTAMTIPELRSFFDFYNRPLAISRRAPLVRFLEGQTLVGGLPSIHDAVPSAGILSDRVGQSYERDGRYLYDVVDGVAVITIEGYLIAKGSFVGSAWGVTSYQGLQAQIAAAAKSERIRGVVFEIDTYGGPINGLFQTAEMIHRLSEEKPTMAILTDNALSAGYLMASQTRQVVATEHGRLGSIGVIALHVDLSKAHEEMGIAVTVLSAGAHKADGNPYEPLGEDVAERIRAELESVRQSFAAVVARRRGKRMTKADALATEALDYSGTEAVNLGLADATGQPHDAFAAFLESMRAR